MRRNPNEIYRRPEVILGELIRKEARGEAPPRLIHRAVVMAIDLDGGKLQNPTGNGTFSFLDRGGKQRNYPALLGPENPQGSVKARILTNGFDRLLEDKDLRVFWPMIPIDQLGMPISPGEHVYVMFEGEGTDHGIWMHRVAGHESANSFQGVDAYTASSTLQSAMDQFEPNQPTYQLDDAYAGEAPLAGAMSSFEGD